MGTSKKDWKKNRLVQNSFFPVILIFGLWIIFSHAYFFQGLIPFPSRYLVSFFNPWINYYGMPVKNEAMPDVITQILPWKKITIENLKQGHLPLWNPYQFSGNPHLANVQSAVFTPFNLLFFIFPFLDAWSLLILLQPLLAGCFTYIFLRSLLISKSGSLMGSFSFMFSSFIVTWMAYGTLGYAILYLPLFLYGIERFLTKSDWFSKLVLILAPPLTIFSGHFQTSLYVLIVAIVYLIGRCIVSKKTQILLQACVYIGIGLLISSLQILPTLGFYSQSVRGTSYMQEKGIPWSQLIRIIAPDFYGNPVTRNDWVGHYAEWGTYAGLIPLFLGIFVFLKRRKNFYISFFGIIAIISILFSFETPFVALLGVSKIPVLSTSAPSRIVGIISFCIAVLSSFGIDYLKSEWKKRDDFKKILSILVIGSLVIITGWLLIFGGNLPKEARFIAQRNFLLPSVLFICLFLLCFVGYFRFKYMQKISVLLLLVLTSLEMLRFSSKWMPFESKEYMYPELPVIKYLEENSHESRVYGLIGNEVFSYFNLYGIEGYDPLYSKRYGEFISSAGDGKIYPLSKSTVVFPRTGIYAKRMLDILGVKYVLQSKGDGYGSWLFPFWKYPESYSLPVYSDEKYEIYENKSVFPRAYLVYSYKVIKDDQQIIDEIFSPQNDFRKTVILEDEPKEITNKLEDCKDDISNSSVNLDEYKTTNVLLKTNSPCPSILVFSDAYYPGWVAYVDGKKSPIYRANYTFRAIPIQKGEHTILLKYENWYL
jgi:uncharacterized membrane protein YfhO